MSGAHTKLCRSSEVIIRHSGCCQQEMLHRGGGILVYLLTMEGISINRNGEKVLGRENSLNKDVKA